MMVTRPKRPPASSHFLDDRATIVMDPHRRLNIQCQEIPELIQILKAVYAGFIEEVTNG